MPQDSVEIIPVPDQDLTAVRGRGLTAAFARHAHQSLVLGLVDDGVRRIELASGSVSVSRGECFVLAPGQGHRCASGQGQPHSYRVLCLPAGAVPALERLAAPMVRTSEARPLFDRFFKMLPPHADTRAERLRLVTELLLHLVANADLVDSPPVPSRRPEHPGVAAAIRAVRDAPQHEHSLEQLADLACMSKFHFQRRFLEETGMSPADFRLQCRINRALALIAAGTPLAEAGLACGFADQSHFTRSFRRAVGVPPGRFLQHNPPPPEGGG